MQIFMIIFAAIARLIPHPWNFTPMGGIALFAGATMPLRTALLVPIIPLVLSDLIVGFYDWQVMLGVYLGFTASVFIGRALIKGREKLPFIAGGIGLNALVFYLITNFSVWATGYYPMTFEGLVACYVAGLPFLGVSLAGDSLYAGILFGSKALFERRIGAVPGLYKGTAQTA